MSYISLTVPLLQTQVASGLTVVALLPVLEVLALLLLIGASCVLVCVDLRYRRLPNTWVACVALAGCMLMPSRLLCTEPWQTRLCAGVLTLLLLSAAECIWRRIVDKPGMGAGDIKLLAALALCLGSQVAVLLLLACISACVTAVLCRQRSFAFGPHIVGAAVVLLLLP